MSLQTREQKLVSGYIALIHRGTGMSNLVQPIRHLKPAEKQVDRWAHWHDLVLSPRGHQLLLLILPVPVKQFAGFHAPTRCGLLLTARGHEHQIGGLLLHLMHNGNFPNWRAEILLHRNSIQVIRR